LHKQSRQTANAYDCAAIESLGMKAMQKALNFGKPADGNGWGMSARLLGYKLDE
jgi:putative transposase